MRILTGLRDRYEAHHHVHYSDEALHAAVSLSNRYIQDRFQPDKAIDVLDEAGARMRIRSRKLPDDVMKINEELRRVRKDKEQAIAAQDFERARRNPLLPSARRPRRSSLRKPSASWAKWARRKSPTW